MMESIIVALITGGLSLAGVILTVRAGNQRISTELKIHQAVQDEKLSNLTDEVHKHNSFAERVPLVEARYDALEKRVTELERGEKA